MSKLHVEGVNFSVAVQKISIWPSVWDEMKFVDGISSDNNIRKIAKKLKNIVLKCRLFVKLFKGTVAWDFLNYNLPPNIFWIWSRFGFKTQEVKLVKFPNPESEHFPGCKMCQVKIRQIWSRFCWDIHKNRKIGNTASENFLGFWFSRIWIEVEKD